MFIPPHLNGKYVCVWGYCEYRIDLVLQLQTADEKTNMAKSDYHYRCGTCMYNVTTDKLIKYLHYSTHSLYCFIAFPLHSSDFGIHIIRIVEGKLRFDVELTDKIDDYRQKNFTSIDPREKKKNGESMINCYKTIIYANSVYSQNISSK